MNKTILIIGSGGREHALGWKLAQSPLCKKLFFAPGNGGTQDMGTNVDIDAENIDALVDFAKKNSIDLTVVGPEGPLCKGIVNAFEKHDLRIFGPSKMAARLEGNKAFADEFMSRHTIPCPKSRTFNKVQEAIGYLQTKSPDEIVIKASGLAAGKGVILPKSSKEAVSVIKKMMSGDMFGTAGRKVVIQERLSGREVSILAFTDGKTVVPLISSQDHKRVYDKDRGPNTGGMGAYAPVPLFTHKMLKEVMKKILQPTIDGMRAEGNPYKGVLYAGLMLTKQGPKVLEFNVRFGDPECQPLMMLLKSDLVEIMEAGMHGSLKKGLVKFYDGTSVCVVLAASGYPESYRKGTVIEGLDSIDDPDVQIFHAGTAAKNTKIVTGGGRVLGVTAKAPNIKGALDKAYSSIGKHGVHFKGMHYRRDIGWQALSM